MKDRWIMVVEIVAAISCLIFGILWLFDPLGPYEAPFSVSGFILVLSDLYRRHIKNSLDKHVNENDIQLFEEFLTLLSDDDLIRFYKEHDFLTSFERRFVNPLYEFIEAWDNAAHEFVDSELEGERKNLYDSAKSLGDMMAKNTCPNRYGLISVRSDNLPAGPTPDWVLRDAAEINALAPPFVELHENFIRLGRRKLYGG